jgi:hypothetical protein
VYPGFPTPGVALLRCSLGAPGELKFNR